MAGTWALYIYVLRRSHFFPDPSKMPTRATLWDHISTAQVALFSYAVLPLLVAFLAENKITRTFSHVSDVGVPMYAAYHAVYLACVEVRRGALRDGVGGGGGCCGVMHGPRVCATEGEHWGRRWAE